MTAADKNVPIVLVLLILYGASIYYVGFFVGTVAYMIAHMTVLGVRSPMVLAGVTAGLLLVSYVTMEVLLGVVLPRGSLFQGWF